MRSSHVMTALVLGMLVNAGAVSAETQAVTPPSGHYKNVATDELWYWDEESGTYTNSGFIDSNLCVGVPEERIFVAGVCMDLDVTGLSHPQGFSGAGRVLLVDDWEVDVTLTVNGVYYSYCQPVCFGDAIPNISYFAFSFSYPDVCDDFPGRHVLNVHLEVSARLEYLVSLTANEDVTVDCDGYVP